MIELLNFIATRITMKSNNLLHQFRFEEKCLSSCVPYKAPYRSGGETALKQFLQIRRIICVTQERCSLPRVWYW